MRLLFLLLWRNNFTLFFILLQSICLYLLVRNNRFQQASVLNATNKVVTTTMEGVNYVKEYIHLRDNNNLLAEENAKLRALLNEAQYDNDSSAVTIKDSASIQQYTYLDAKVINNSISHRNNFITLNKGRLQGVLPEMGVITEKGVVGIVNHVSDHYCTVMSLLHKETNISAMIKRNKFFGSLKWEGNDPNYAYLNEIDKTVPIQKGDTIVTTSFSTVFPANIMIGRVEQTLTEPGSPFFKIKVKLSMNFGNLSHVYIVKNLMKQEQEQLEVINKPKEDEQ
ncbi:MAG: rod shape-determining protein MreC [Bacteroidetes bacterium]|nr:rod shape-determining protein MreC [Bacteroidota bacterium]MBL0096601.1 rod shape-determining protein MreC [Bacteroidota bacterium]